MLRRRAKVNDDKSGSKFRGNLPDLFPSSAEDKKFKNLINFSFIYSYFLIL